MSNTTSSCRSNFCFSFSISCENYPSVLTSTGDKRVSLNSRSTLRLVSVRLRLHHVTETQLLFFLLTLRMWKTDNCCNYLKLTPTSSFQTWFYCVAEMSRRSRVKNTSLLREQRAGEDRCHWPEEASIRRVGASHQPRPSGGSWNFTAVCHIWNLLFI